MGMLLLRTRLGRGFFSQWTTRGHFAYLRTQNMPHRHKLWPCWLAMIMGTNNPPPIQSYQAFFFMATLWTVEVESRRRSPLSTAVGKLSRALPCFKDSNDSKRLHTLVMMCGLPDRGRYLWTSTSPQCNNDVDYKRSETSIIVRMLRILAY